jgi:lycopene cyclase domain-containing protein
MNWEYALFNLIIISAPLIGGLLYKRTIWPSLRKTVLSITPISLIFIIIDELVTGVWWSFNPTFISGLYIGKLPIEEIAFFISVPFACLFLYLNLKNLLVAKQLSFPHNPLLLAIIPSALISLLNGLWYTLTVLAATTGIILTDKHYSGKLSQRTFLIFMGITIVFTALFNGYLTARPVVTYNADYKSTIQVGTVPIEDFFYGLILIYAVIYRYDTLCSRSDSNTRPTA